MMIGCAHKPGTGSYLDGATTWYAIESSEFVELNPLFDGLSGPQSFLASIAVKQGMKYTITPLVGDEKADAYIETSGMVAGSWNLALILGATNPVSGVIAITSGIMYWQYVNQQQQSTIQ